MDGLEATGVYTRCIYFFLHVVLLMNFSTLLWIVGPYCCGKSYFYILVMVSRTNTWERTPKGAQDKVGEVNSDLVRCLAIWVTNFILFYLSL